MSVQLQCVVKLVAHPAAPGVAAGEGQCWINEG